MVEVTNEQKDLKEEKEFSDLTPEEKEILQITLEERLTSTEWSHYQFLQLNRPKWRNKNLIGKVITFTGAVAVKIRRSHYGKYMEPDNYQQRQNIDFNINKWTIDDYDMRHDSPIEVARSLQDDDFNDASIDILKKAVEEIPLIDWVFLYKTLMMLRLTDSSITKIDIGLMLYENLHVLVLAANWIEEVPGEYLPRKLQFLELYSNSISTLNSLCKKAPKRLKHLGLGRNPLTDGSNLHLLVKSKNFLQLRTLDLSDGDICDLKAAVRALQKLESLAGILLAGNPCSVSKTYKDMVIHYLPNVRILDNKEIAIEDRKSLTLDEIESGIKDPEFIFTCHRLIGLPPPPKEVINKQKVQCFFHMEVTIPLLEEYKLEPELLEVDSSHAKMKKKKSKSGKLGRKGSSRKSLKSHSKGSRKSMKGSRKSLKGSKKSLKGSKKSLKGASKASVGSKKNKKGSSKSSVGSKKGKKKGKKGSKASLRGKKGKKGKHDGNPYSAPDEYANEVKKKIVNRSFKTERVPYSKIIQFPEDALTVKVPKCIEKQLTLMRDVFRTVANVKAVFTQVLPPPKKSKKDKKGKKDKKDKKDKKGKKDKKDKHKGKEKDSHKSKDKIDKHDKDKGKGKGGHKHAKGSKSRSGHSLHKSDSKPKPEPEPEPEPTETIVKKITLASFNCELHHPNWANKTEDYYWCNDERFPKNKGVEVEGSLRNIKYTEAKKKKKGDKKEKGKKDKDSKKGKKGKSSKSSLKSSKTSVKSGSLKKKKKGSSKSSVKSGGSIKGKKGKKGKSSKSSIKSKGSHKGKKGSKSKVSKVSIEEDEYQIMRVAPKEDVLPDVFTVQVGFGLQRNLPPPPPPATPPPEETELPNPATNPDTEVLASETVKPNTPVTEIVTEVDVTMPELPAK